MSKMDRIINVITDTHSKNAFRIFFESLHAGIIEREAPHFYFYNLLYKKDAGNYRKFIGSKKRQRILKFYDDTNNEYLTDKIKFSKKLLENNINTPKIFAYTDKNHIIYNDSTHIVSNRLDLFELIESMIEASKNKTIFVKPTDGSRGKDSFKLLKDQNLKIKVDKLFDSLKDIQFIFQETIIQDDRVNEIYSKSLNTIRVHAYFDKETKKNTIISAVMRFGAGGNEVDNVSSGGMFVPINIHSQWKLEGNGKTFFEKGGSSFESHPDTGYVFSNFIIPYQENIIDLVFRTSTLFENQYIGWDIAITPDGPLIIEGNDRPHIIMAQIACGGFKGHPEYNKIFDGVI